MFYIRHRRRKLEAYLRAFVKLKQQNEVVSENITRMEAREKEMEDEGFASKKEVSDLTLQLAEARTKLVGMTELKEDLEESMGELRLEVAQAIAKVGQGE